MNCSKKSSGLCKREECKGCFERSLASYKEKTKKGKLKIDCILEVDPRFIAGGSEKKI
jgi:hypothetical protein